jgi:hypothetical protein
MESAMTVPSGEMPSLFVQQVSALLAITELRLANSHAEKEAIYAQRYKGYLHAGTIGANAEQRFTDEFDFAPNSFSVGLYIDSSLVASIRLSVAGRAFPASPSTRAFGDLLVPGLEAGRIVIDPTRNVVSLDGGQKYPKLPYLTARVAWLAGEFFGADAILAAVRPEHQAFFRRTFGHQVVCEARPYPALQKPISLMTLDFPAARERVIQRYPFYGSTQEERDTLFGTLRGLRDQLHGRCRALAS